MEKIQLTTPFVTLGQLLKQVNIIPSGGAAKYYLKDFPVQINGETDDRRGRKLYAGDLIVLADGQQYQIEGEH